MLKLLSRVFSNDAPWILDLLRMWACINSHLYTRETTVRRERERERDIYMLYHNITRAKQNKTGIHVIQAYVHAGANPHELDPPQIASTSGFHLWYFLCPSISPKKTGYPYRTLLAESPDPSSNSRASDPLPHCFRQIRWDDGWRGLLPRFLWGLQWVGFRARPQRSNYLIIIYSPKS